MNKLTLKIENYNLENKYLLDYLLNLKGITNITNNKDDDQYITIEYTKETTIEIIVKEIQLFLNIKEPNISYFNKHEDKKEEYIINIKDLCCEYCLNSMIEELLYIEGINEAYSNFNGNKKDVKTYIYYDKNKITKEELMKLEKEF